jgi:uncharacterized protein YndB with AHSA1/START domain
LDRLWAGWADPRQIERFWGPPQWPATFTRHDMTEGGRTESHMTGPGGEVARGYWRFVRVQAPHAFEVMDGFTHEDGTPNRELPETRMLLRFQATPTGSRFVGVSKEMRDAILATGMVDGMEAPYARLEEEALRIA